MGGKVRCRAGTNWQVEEEAAEEGNEAEGEKEEEGEKGGRERCERGGEACEEDGERACGGGLGRQGGTSKLHLGGVDGGMAGEDREDVVS